MQEHSLSRPTEYAMTGETALLIDPTRPPVPRSSGRSWKRAGRNDRSGQTDRQLLQLCSGILGKQDGTHSRPVDWLTNWHKPELQMLPVISLLPATAPAAASTPELYSSAACTCYTDALYICFQCIRPGRDQNHAVLLDALLLASPNRRSA